MALRSNSHEISYDAWFLRKKQEPFACFQKWRYLDSSEDQRSFCLHSSLPRSEWSWRSLLTQYTKDRNQLTAYSSLTNGRFLIIPAKDALEFTEGTSRELLARLDKCEARLAKVGEEELMYARDVARWSKRFDVVGNHVDPWVQEVEKKSAAEISRGVTKGVGNRRELVTISQLQPDTFYDVQGEVSSPASSLLLDLITQHPLLCVDRQSLQPSRNLSIFTRRRLHFTLHHGLHSQRPAHVLYRNFKCSSLRSIRSTNFCLGSPSSSYYQILRKWRQFEGKIHTLQKRSG